MKVHNIIDLISNQNVSHSFQSRDRLKDLEGKTSIHAKKNGAILFFGS